MALVVKDRVKETTTSTGTGTITLGGASAGFQTFSVIGNGNTTYYTIVDPATGAWEVGIGTYTASGTTLSRTTVLESSNAGSLVNFAAGSKDVFVTYPAERSVYLNSAGSAVDVLDVGTLGVSTANITTANITAGTVSTTPSSGTDIANKTYVDTIASSGVTYHTPVKYEVPSTTGNLNATYNNGTAGVGATLTNAGTLGAFTPDGVVASVNDRILIYNQTNAAQNGVYTVTTVGNGSTAWVLTRATDADSYAVKDPNALGEGDAFFVTSGNTGAGETYICNTQGTITFGTTAINFVQVSSAQIYSAGTGLTLTNTTFSITNTGVSATTYGSASAVPVFAVNAQGQLTSVTNTNIAISAGAISGLAPSATTDTTDATNITSGTLPTGRLNGSYTGVTGVGTLTAGTWNAATIAPAYGGTGITSYTIGDILYADGSGSLAKLPDVATGNALISGGVGTAPSWGKIGLQTHISGTLQATNGGTGATTLTGYVYGNGTGAMTASTTIPNSATTATSANTASAIVARDASGNFSAGTITASLSGNATTATTASATTAAATFNNGGAGDASGTTFNGSTARTISYNTVGASPLAGSSSLTTTGTVTSGTWSALFGAVSGANLTNLTAGNLSGTIPSAVLGNSTTYVGTTAIALNRATANQALTGITSVTFPGATSGSVQLIPAATAGTGTVLTMPATTGTVITSGDTGTVTSTMIADGTIVNADINASAAIAVSKLAASTISGVTLGGTLNTLTMNTSGTGLSGSTTYNGSGASTFTVTSNATNANTASTIVARDASGNFSAGTITANLSGNVNGTIGATTPTTGAFTTLTTSSTVTLNGGTANGVLYLNGSKVATSGSGMTYDGTNFGVGSASLSFITGYSGVQINSSQGAVLKFTNPNTGTTSTDGFDLILGNNSLDAFIWQRESAAVIFGTSATERARITSAGAWSFGSSGTATGTSGQVLTSNGSGSAPSWQSVSSGITISDDTTTNATRYPVFEDVTSGSSSTAQVSSTKLTFNPSTGTLSATVMTASSDETLKTNWRNLPDLIEGMAGVKHGEFDWLDGSGTDVGVSAQALMQVLATAVKQGDKGKLSVNYGGAALVVCVQLCKRVLALEAEIERLKKGAV